MSLADALEDLLAARPATAGEAVEGWRYELATGASFRVGVREGKLGGPFQSPALAVGVGGWLELRWSDGLVTSTSIDRATAAEFSQRLEAWRVAAFHDPWIVPLPGPCTVPSVETFDPSLREVVEGDVGSLLARLATMQSALAVTGLPHVDLSIGAAHGERWIRSSAGLRVDFPETMFTASVSAGELYWESLGSRRLPGPAEIDGLSDRVATIASALREDDNLPTGSPAVLLAPPVVEAFIGRFVQSNLSGQSVVNGHSTFSLDDFTQRRPVVRDDLDLVVDTTLPFEPATSPCSPEGVPAGRVGLIEGGRLRSPGLNLKWAARAGLPPTPAPRGSPPVLLQSSRPPLTLEEALELLDPGLLVYFVIGAHTQNQRTGRYSLVAPQAQVVRRGRRGGKVRVRLAGSFFDDLSDTSTRLVRFPDQRNPGLIVRCSVSGERA